MAAAFGLRWCPDHGIANRLIRACASPRRSHNGVRLRTCRGCRDRLGLQIGKPRRASGDAVRPRIVVATDSRAEQGLEVASALPKNDRGARTRGDARTASREGEALKGRHRWESAESSQACGAGAWQPDEPQGRMRDATSPRTCRRRKPSRPGGTARAERARHREMPGRSERKLAGVDSSRVADGGEVFEKPYGRRLACTSRAAAKRVSDSGYASTRRVVRTHVQAARSRGTTT